MNAEEHHNDEVKKLLGEILVEMGYAKIGMINEARKLQMNSPDRKLGDFLIELGYVKPEHIEEALKKQKQYKERASI